MDFLTYFWLMSTFPLMPEWLKIGRFKETVTRRAKEHSSTCSP